jgi:translation initiation factor 3 subunit H
MATAADILKRVEVKETTLKTVQLDGQVVLKIMQHCDGALPGIVTGQLLGLDVGQTMEVTDCFPFPVRGFSTRRPAAHVHVNIP